MNRVSIRRLLDKVLDERSLNVSDLGMLARAYGVRPFDPAFLMKIGARYPCWSIPQSFPQYVKSFLRLCMDQLRDRHEMIYGSAPTVSDIHYRVLVTQYARAIGLSLRERRYQIQLDGLEGFCSLRPIELAKQDGVTPAYICKVQARFRRKMQLAVVGSELQSERAKRKGIE